MVATYFGLALSAAPLAFSADQQAGSASAEASPQIRTELPSTQRVDPYVDVLRRYIRGCNTGDLELMMSTFAADIVVYFIEQPPVRGREAVAKFWKDYHETNHARWTVDHVVVQGNEAVMEWSSFDASADQRGEAFQRGVDWFVFDGNRIAEIRQYYDVRGYLPAEAAYELKGFPYRERGYPLPENLDARLP
jgi:ketosteroid isomerase-like protein